MVISKDLNKQQVDTEKANDNRIAAIGKIVADVNKKHTDSKKPGTMIRQGMHKHLIVHGHSEDESKVAIQAIEEKGEWQCGACRWQKPVDKEQATGTV